MTPQQILGVGIRLFAIIVALHGIGYFTSLPKVLTLMELDDKAYAAYAVGTSYFLAALFLWFFPLSVASRLIPRTKYENKLRLQPLEAARVGCALIGLWFFTKALPDTTWFLFSLFVFSGPESPYRSWDADTRMQLAVTFFQVGFALILLFRSSDVAALLIRDKASPVKEPAAADSP